MDEIEFIRAQQNKRWMKIVRIAMKHAPQETKLILLTIQHGDKDVAELTGRLCE